jgi:alkylation response protein AidB-like acyl-CoA dehydrogenase
VIDTMDFEHSQDRRMLAATLDRFVRENYGFDTRQRIAGSPEGCSREMWRRLADLGVLAALFDEVDGGMGGAGFDIMVVFESLGRGLLVEPFAGALMAGRILAGSANPAAHALLHDLIAGERIVVLAHEEGDTGALVSRIATHAEIEGDEWKLSGVKCAVPQAEAADAFVVTARSAGAVGDENGLSLFLVPADAAGLALHGYPLIDGGRGADVMLDSVTLGSDALLAPAGGGSTLLKAGVGCGLLALAAESLGAMEAVKEATLDYLRTRKQFGVPIGSFQALQHRMADLLLEIEQARSAVINAADKLAAPLAVRERTLAAAKHTVGRVGTLVAEESIQLHGGVGMTWELPLAHYAKRLVMIDHQLGDEDQHLAHYIELGRCAPEAP